MSDSDIMTHSQSCWLKKNSKCLKMWKIIVVNVAGNKVGQHFGVGDGHIMQNPDAQLNNMPSNTASVGRGGMEKTKGSKKNKLCSLQNVWRKYFLPWVIFFLLYSNSPTLDLMLYRSKKWGRTLSSTWMTLQCIWADNSVKLKFILTQFEN